MNFLTIFTPDATDVSDRFLAKCKEHGGGNAGDVLVVICNKWLPEGLDEFKAEAEKYFSSVLTISRSLKPFEGNTLEAFSEEVFSKNVFFTNCLGRTCYIPFGFVPNKDGWASDISDEFSLCEKGWMGDTKIANKETGQTYLSGAFVTDAYNFKVIPMFRVYSSKATACERAFNYTSGDTHTYKMPFSPFKEASDTIPVPVTPVGSSEPSFGVDTPVKVSTLSTGPTAKQPVKKTAKKKVAKKKTAKKKTARPHKPKAPINPAVVAEVDAQLNQ